MLGPLVEGSFNIMDIIIIKNYRFRLNIETYEGITIFKSNIQARGKTASNIEICPALKRKCLSSYERYKTHFKLKKERIKRQTEMKLRKSVKVLSAIGGRKGTKASTFSTTRAASTAGVRASRPATASSSTAGVRAHGPVAHLE